MKQKGNVMMDEAELLTRLRLETFCTNLRAEWAEQVWYYKDAQRAGRAVAQRVIDGIVEYESWGI